MSGLVLSGGTLLSVLQGKKVYQPIWQIIATNSSQANGNPSSQILLSDGEYYDYDVYIVMLVFLNIQHMTLTLCNQMIKFSCRKTPDL